MRFFSVFLFVVVGLATLQSCSKDEEMDNASLLVGRWQMTEVRASFAGQTDTEPADPNFPNYFTFDANGTVSFDGYISEEIDGREVMLRETTSSEYALSPDGQRLTMIEDGDSQSFTIRELTNSTFRMSSEMDGGEIELSFRRAN